MCKKLIQLVACLVLFLAASNILFADGSEKGSSPEPSEKFSANRFHKGLSELSVWSGYSFDSISGKFLALTPGRQFAIVGLQYGRILAAGNKLALAYTFDVIPMAMVTNNPQTEVTDEGIFSTEYVHRTSVYGFGLSPIGLKFYFLQASRIKFFTNASCGFLTFLNEVPVEEARKFNFTFDLGLGMQISTGSRWALTFGYKLHHLSNAKTAHLNPGLDSSVFYLGVSSFR